MPFNILKLILIIYLSFDIVILPNKNAYVNQKWPKANAIPYVIDSSFGKASHFIHFIFMNPNLFSYFNQMPRRVAPSVTP
jgi:hypothetical protein